MRFIQKGVIALALVASASFAAAAEVRVLSVGSTSIAAKAIADAFTKITGHQVTFTIRPPFNIDEELKSKTFDAIILAVPAMDIHDKAGNIAPGSRVPLARVGVGVAVKTGAYVPDVSTPEKFKAALLAAKSLTHSDPALPNTSGAIAAASIAKLGIADAVTPKTRFAALAVAGKLVANGEVEMGFFNVSEFPPGTTLAGTLPDPLQRYTVYEAAVLAKGSKDDAVAAFVKLLGSSGPLWQAAKLEPAASYLSALTR